MVRRSCWLVKQEPAEYAFAQLIADGSTCWSGVRNHQARNNLAAMKTGDPVVYYHSGSERAAVGLARVVAGARPDPTAGDDDRWLAVDLAPVRPLVEPVPLAAFKADPLLQDSDLVRQPRLSVVKVTAPQWRRILALARTPA